jgi:hypothetical protein
MPYLMPHSPPCFRRARRRIRSCVEGRSGRTGKRPSTARVLATRMVPTAILRSRCGGRPSRVLPQAPGRRHRGSLSPHAVPGRSGALDLPNRTLGPSRADVTNPSPVALHHRRPPQPPLAAAPRPARTAIRAGRSTSPVKVTTPHRGISVHPADAVPVAKRLRPAPLSSSKPARRSMSPLSAHAAAPPASRGHCLRLSAGGAIGGEAFLEIRLHWRAPVEDHERHVCW